MRSAIGNTSLLTLIILFIGILVIFFVGVFAYAKAYKAKNAVIEVIEKYETYNTEAENEIFSRLADMGYQMGDCDKTTSIVTDDMPFKYCVERFDVDKHETPDAERGTYYKVTTYVEFLFPVIGDAWKIPVTSETKVLGKTYLVE